MRWKKRPPAKRTVSKNAPKPFKTTDGIHWFLVSGPKSRPTTPGGAPRKGYPDGIYLEDLKGRADDRSSET